jgi:hypothetical protein
MGEAVEDVANNFGLALVGGEDFYRPVGCNCEGIGHFAVLVTGNAFPSEDGNIRNERPATKSAAEF